MKLRTKGQLKIRGRSHRHLHCTLALAVLLVLTSGPALAENEREFFFGGAGKEPFDLLEPFYFISGPDKNEDADIPIENRQVRFRLAVRYRLASQDYTPQSDTPTTFTAQWHLAYTQDAFWNLWDESAPFYENMFAPETYIFLSKSDLPFGIAGGIRHQSNGRAGPLSRSWNRYYEAITFGNPGKNALYGYLSVWGTWGVAPENEDIVDQVGRGELVLFFAPGAITTPTSFGINRLGLILKQGLAGNDAFEAFDGSLLFQIQQDKAFALSILIQYFSGHGHMLRDYDRSQTIWRAGFAIAN